eukprot:jgi/Tetstr1/456505/TSEL_043227.t1
MSAAAVVQPGRPLRLAAAVVPIPLRRQSHLAGRWRRPLGRSLGVAVGATDSHAEGSGDRWESVPDEIQRREDLALVISSVEGLQREVEALRAERRDALSAGQRNSQRAARFQTTLRLLEEDAVQKLRAADEDAARRVVQQRAVVSEATRKADARAQACRQLADKLVEHIEAKQHEIRTLLDLGRKVAQRLEGGSPTPPADAPVSEAALEDAFLALERSSLEALFEQSPSEEGGPGSGAAGAGGGSARSEAPPEESPSCANQEEDAPPSDAVDWWAMGLAALQEGHTLGGGLPHGAAGGAGPDAAERDRLAAALLKRAASRHSAGEEPQAGDLQALVALAFPAGTGDGLGPMPLPAAAKIASEYHKALRLGLLQAGVRAAIAAAREGEPVDSCRSSVVGLAALLDVGEAEAAGLAAQAALEAAHRSLLAAVVELRQDAAAAAATLAEEAARMCLAFPPTGAEQLRHTAERLQSFLSQGERRELRRLWSACQRPEDCQPTARWLADQLLGGVE